MPIVLTQKDVRMRQAAFKAALSVACLAMLVGGFRYLSFRSRTNHLADQVAAQKSALFNLRQSMASAARSHSLQARPAGDAVQHIQNDIERVARSSGCTVEEFQATPDRSQYISVFTADTNQPGWQQIPVRLTLRGSLVSALATVNGLQSDGIPVEPDSIEMTRQTTAGAGASQVSLRFAFRVLVRAGGSA